MEIEAEAVRFNAWFAVSFQRTLRVPDHGRKYPLPPGLGAFPVYSVAKYAAHLSPELVGRGGVFIPVYQREALWLALRAAPFRAHAVKVAVGGFNALTGAPHDRILRSDPQDYLVCPPQIWLDGVRTHGETIRQFVAMPLGSGATIEASLRGAEIRGGIQLAVFEARAGRFPELAPEQPERPAPLRSAAGATLGFAAGGQIAQRLYPDPYGVDTWQTSNVAELEVHLLNSFEFERVTGTQPPASPIEARTYSERGFPWFELYDEHYGDLGASPQLSGVTTLDQYETLLDPSRVDSESTDPTEAALPVRRIPLTSAPAVNALRDPNAANSGDEAPSNERNRQRR